MSYLTVLHTPEAKLDYLIIAFQGWADAGEGASAAVKFLQRELKARKFAEIDPEEFYDFTETRPYTTRARDGRRRVIWPANEFSYWAGTGLAKGAMTFLGVEPNLRWRTFSRTIAQLAQEHGVKTVVHVGALLDAVPHTRRVKLSGTATSPDLQRALDEREIRGSNYRGPTGISSAVMEACASMGIDYASLWAHIPHYLQAAPNYRVGYTLALTLSTLLDLPLELNELRSAASSFDEEVEKAIAQDEQLSAYANKLESRYDESSPPLGIPDPAELVRDLEQFLKSEQRRRPGDHQP